GTARFARHWLSARHLLRQPSECAGAGQGVAAGPRVNPHHRRRAHAASLSIAQLVLGAEKASRDQAGRAPRWRLLQGQVCRAPRQAGPGNDINAGSPGFPAASQAKSGVVFTRPTMAGRSPDCRNFSARVVLWFEGTGLEFITLVPTPVMIIAGEWN